MRIKLNEITVKRLYEAFKRRVFDIPDVINWKHSESGNINRRKLIEFKDIHKGKRCFIIANGPSLTKMDLAPLKNEITFGMNRIYLAFDKIGFVPNYYVVSNELVIEQFSDDIKNLDTIKFLNWDRRLLFKNCTKVNYIKTKMSINDGFSTDILDGIFSGGTVTYATLQLVFYMGFSEVFLIGLDHNFAEKGTPNKTEVRTSDIDKSHFHPNYFPKGIKWQLPDLYRSELAYEKALYSYQSAGRKIWDATIDGKCNVFPKVDYNSIINSKK